MNKLDLRRKIQEALEAHFVNDEKNEWVDVDKVNINRVDVNIVTSINEKLSESNEFIQKTIDFFNENLDKVEKVYLGFSNIHNVDEAEFLGLEKPIRKGKLQVSFSDIIDNYENDLVIEKKYKPAKVISFYSYKGGVGRTIALIQTANLLAAKGKKVALIDMDIEAPSFNEIFSEEIEKENGLVNYLYNKLYKLEDISVSAITSKLTLNTKGDVYIIPAGSLNKKYVKTLELLKEKRISENEYIEQLIGELHNQYGIEYILIDSRTGINNWGALSIGEIADEVILLAYPNKENVQGINLILDMIENKKKCTVIFSRIDVTDEGKKRAKQFFDEINIEQEFIGIEYDSSIALSTKYPLENRLNKFNCISDIILEDEVNNKNKSWIKDNEQIVEKILDNISNGKDFENILTNDEMKFNDKSNCIIIKESDSNLKDIVDSFKNNEDLVEFNFHNIKFKYDYDSLSNIYLVIINMLAVACVNCNCFIKSDEKHNIIQEFKEYFNALISGVDNKDNFVGKVRNNLNDILNSFEQEGKFERLYVILNIDNIMSYEFKNIKDEKAKLKLILIIADVLNLRDKIQFKLVFNEIQCSKYEEELKEVNANTLNLSWQNLRLDKLTDKVKELLDKTSQCASGDMIDADIITSKINLSEDFNSGSIIYNPIFKSYIESDLIYCKRINQTKYSKEFVVWLSEMIKEKKLVSKKYVLEVIKESANIEKNTLKEGKYSIITFDSFNKAINKFSPVNN